MSRESVRKPCRRCGISVTIGGRTGPVVICRDCRDVDALYISVLLQEAS